jgi:chemotaxis protein MotB
MSSKKPREMSESGMLVYPKLPVPKRESEPRFPTKGSSGGSTKLVLFLLFLALAGGAVGGFVVRPMILEDTRLADAQNALAKEKLAVAEGQQNVAKLQDESKKLDEQRELLNQQLEAAKQAQEAFADKAADQTKVKADLDAAKKKLEATGAGTVSIDPGAELRVTIPTATLFKANDELSPAGIKVLDKVAGALKELADKHVAIHGHTDDTPPPKPAAPKAPKPKKGEKPAAPAPAEPTFATNWELSSARALAVLHYFQDKHKIEATRLSMQAFGQYKPVSKSNKAANRRIELVLTTVKPKK